MKIVVTKEIKDEDKRVAITPDTVKTLVKAGFDVMIENGAGSESFISDEQYVKAGANIVSGAADLLTQADVLLKVNPPSLKEIDSLKSGCVVISFLYAFNNKDIVDALVRKNISAFSMDAVPRTTKAQRMDALSSQASLGGYKAVMMGANALGKIFPLMMTAAGTITPAKTLIFGAGVAGLQALATAKRLGSVVEVTDIRPGTKEEVESIGGRFLQVEGDDSVKVEGGYVKEVSEEYLRKQKEMINKHVADADLVITTAAVLGRKSPVLISAEMVETMKTGAVIVDLAAESGGNCALTQVGKTIIHNGVTIIGERNLPGLLPQNSSEMYSRNISTLFLYLADNEGFKWDLQDEITKGCLITHKGEIVHEATKTLFNT
ncbi:MAG: Re/Si-specific NAD(P)(+) transhydrogenase subunit alpha [Saprospiraceae bacterium]|nr:Re/Si-specific NAD(P)(+) transhydrogenase subunit alpha [Saprospiraceae bacterium]